MWHHISVLAPLVIAEFKIKVDDGSNTVLNLTDNTGAKIPISKFVDIIITFHKGSMFTVNVEYDSIQDESPIVNPMVSIKIMIFVENRRKITDE